MKILDSMQALAVALATGLVFSASTGFAASASADERQRVSKSVRTFGHRMPFFLRVFGRGGARSEARVDYPGTGGIPFAGSGHLCGAPFCSRMFQDVLYVDVNKHFTALPNHTSFRSLRQ